MGEHQRRKRGSKGRLASSCLKRSKEDDAISGILQKIIKTTLNRAAFCERGGAEKEVKTTEGKGPIQGPDRVLFRELGGLL